MQRVPAAILNQRWTVVPDYPAERAARLYAGYARFIGATEEAMRALQRLTTITEEDITMATNKRNAAPAVKRAAAETAQRHTAVRNEKETLAASVKTGTKARDLPTGGRKETPRKVASPKKAGSAPRATMKKAAIAKKPSPVRTSARGAAAGSTKGTATAAISKAGASAKPAQGSGTFIRELLLKDVGVEAILKQVHARFPDSKAGPSDISWNRSKLRKDGLLK